MAYERKARIGISVRKFADLAGVTETAVRKFIKAGHLAKLPDGSMDPLLAKGDWLPRNRNKVVAVPGVKSADPVIDADGRVLTLAEAELLKETNLARLRELEYDEKSGSVVPVDEVAKMVAAEYAVVRNRMLSIPAEAAPRCAFLNSATEIQAFLETEIKQALEGLSRDAGGS